MATSIDTANVPAHLNNGHSDILSLLICAHSGKPGVAMKSFPRTFKYLLVAVALLAIAACATLMQSKQGVEVGEYGALLRPEAKVSASDWDAINSVLKKYRKSLYKIQTFKN